MDRGNIYSSITTFFLILVMIGIVVELLYLNRGMLEMHEEYDSRIKDQKLLQSLHNKLYYCFGHTIDPEVMLQKLNCMQLQDNWRFSMDYIEYENCPYGPIKELNYRGKGGQETFLVPVQNGGMGTVCPAMVTFYENGVQVPLIYNITFHPWIFLQTQTLTSTVFFYHTTEPSEIGFNVVNMSGEGFYSDTKTNLMKADKTAVFEVPPNSLEPGLYSVNAESTNDQGYTIPFSDAGRFRVVDPDDAPVFTRGNVTPKKGFVEDKFTIWVDIEDYLNVTSATARIEDRNGVVDLVVMNQTYYRFDKKEIISRYTFKGVWDSSNMPDENRSYNISIEAVNIIGNHNVSNPLAQIFLEETPSVWRLVVVPVKYSFPSEYPTYKMHADTFFGHFTRNSPFIECTDPLRHAKVLYLDTVCASATSLCYGDLCSSSCNLAIIDCAKAEYGVEFDKAEGIMNGESGAGGLLGCAGLSDLGNPPHLGSREGGAIHEMARLNSDGSGSSHELGHDFGLCHTPDLAVPPLCPNVDNDPPKICIMNYGTKQKFCTQAYAHLRQHPYLIDYLEGCI